MRRELEPDGTRRSQVDSAVEAQARVDREADTETVRGECDQRAVAVAGFDAEDLRLG
jgi:hypothetical protein